MQKVPTSIKLQPRRNLQLRAIATALNLSITDTISHLIKKEIAAGTIPDGIPGIVVRRAGDKVKIQIDEGAAATVTLEIAHKIADALHSAANEGTSLIYPAPFKSADSFGVTRKGNGIRAQIPFYGPGAESWSSAPSFTPDLARDFADLIRQAAA